MRGNASRPHAGQRFARSPRRRSVGVPQRPQKRCVRSHSTICTARPASAKSSSSSRSTAGAAREAAPAGGSAARRFRRPCSPRRRGCRGSGRVGLQPECPEVAASGNSAVSPFSTTSSSAPRTQNQSRVPPTRSGPERWLELARHGLDYARRRCAGRRSRPSGGARRRRSEYSTRGGLASMTVRVGCRPCSSSTSRAASVRAGICARGRT